MTREHQSLSPIPYKAIASDALGYLPEICARWLPDGKRVGREWVARNPKRMDRNPGSMRVNLATGRWADFAIGEAGGDAISLCAYIFNRSQHVAARLVAGMIGFDLGDHFDVE
jgi:hypothetical protein